MTLTKIDVFGIFIAQATRIWGEPWMGRLRFVLSDDEPGDDVLASLGYAGNVLAIGNTLVRSPGFYTLRLSTRLLDLSLEFIEKIMIHEAIHIGYRRHDANFRRLVLAYGGAMTESHASGAGVRVERKDGARYHVIATFPTVEQARAWAKGQMRMFPGKYRLAW